MVLEQGKEQIGYHCRFSLRSEIEVTKIKKIYRDCIFGY